MIPVTTQNSGIVSKRQSYVVAATADNTRRAYQSGVALFLKWGGTLPATTKQVTDYAIERVDVVKPSTVSNQLIAISQWHVKQGLPDPTQCPELKAIVKGMKRTHGSPKVKAKPFTVSDIVTVCDAWVNSAIEIRNAAVLAIGFFGALRRSEISSLNFQDLEWCNDGLTITLPRSKTDQTGEGKRIAIPAGEGEYCPLFPIVRWIEEAGIKKGPLFRKLTKQGIVSDSPLEASGVTVNRIVKKAALFLGYDETLYSGHSLRRGLATSAANAGAKREDIKRQGGWKSEAVVDGYVDEGSRFINNVVHCLINKEG